ncbi:hypothetical protein V8C44DRAFT_334649 [Trichoderma aethiopicum]
MLTTHKELARRAKEELPRRLNVPSRFCSASADRLRLPAVRIITRRSCGSSPRSVAQVFVTASAELRTSSGRLRCVHVSLPLHFQEWFSSYCMLDRRHGRPSLMSVHTSYMMRMSLMRCFATCLQQRPGSKRYLYCTAARHQRNMIRPFSYRATVGDIENPTLSACLPLLQSPLQGSSSGCLLMRRASRSGNGLRSGPPPASYSQRAQWDRPGACREWRHGWAVKVRSCRASFSGLFLVVQLLRCSVPRMESSRSCYCISIVGYCLGTVWAVLGCHCQLF